MSTNTKNNNTGSQRASAASTRNGKSGDIFRQSGDTNLVAVATTPQKRSTVPQTEKDDHRNTDNATTDGGPNLITTLVLDDLDNEILHAEETDLMFKYYNMLQEKVKWETRGQHTGKFNAMINSTISYGKNSATSTTRKTGSRKVRQSQSPRPQLQKKDNKISKSSTTSTALLLQVNDDSTNQKRNTESILMLPKSLIRQHHHNTIGIHPNHSHSQQKRQRPLLRLYDSTSRITTTTTNGRNSAVLHNSMEMIHDLQLVRATILLPRIYSVVKTTNGSNSSGAVTERKKNELERFLYTKFWKNCMEQRQIYCMCYHPYADDDDDDDVYQNVYWKHFRIHLQSANANSWRCIVIGYRAMVNDAVPFIQQLKLFTHHRNTNDNK